jgi:hypothetical protein
MAQDEKVPYIDADEMHEQLVEFYNAHARPETLFAILNVYQEHAEILEEIEEKMFEHRDSELFSKWREKLHHFSDRVEWYAEAAEGADDPLDAYEVISPPMFDGEYPDELDTDGGGPDSQTLWKLANELVVIGDPRDLSEASLEEMQDHFRTFVKLFWGSIGEEVKSQVTDSMSESAQAVMESAAEAASKLSEEQPEEVVALRTKGANEGRRSIAPLLLAAGAIFLMNKRKSRR